MVPRPIFDDPNRKGSGRLTNKVALISGGDSGIGRAIAVAFAKEGADVVIVYLNEHEDALETREHVEHYGGRCLLISSDLTNAENSPLVMFETFSSFGKLDILVNNAAEMKVYNGLEQIPIEQIEKTFRTNVLSHFYLTRAALPYMKSGGSIINTVSIVAYIGHPTLIDYSASKGAMLAFTRSLSLSLVERGIRVNAVAPGPIWTPLIPSSDWPIEEIPVYGQQTPMKRAGQPVELAPAYVYLASDDSSYVTGQTIHVNGGMAVNG